MIPAMASLNSRTRLRLLSDNGPSYVSSELAIGSRTKASVMSAVVLTNPMTQGKIERYRLAEPGLQLRRLVTLERLAAV
jgi:hypothetical protein